MYARVIAKEHCSNDKMMHVPENFSGKNIPLPLFVSSFHSLFFSMLKFLRTHPEPFCQRHLFITMEKYVPAPY